jgi:protein involved in polysaccharide export with SLBB domain
MSRPVATLRLLTVSLLSLGLAACHGHRRPPPAPLPAAPLAAPAAVLDPPPLPPDALVPAPFVLGPGDAVEVEILGLPNTRRLCLVMPDGRIYYDLLPGLRGEGLTLEGLRALLADNLAEYYRDPQIGITLRRVKSRRVWILGRVNTPGLYPLDQPMTLLEGVARAGGLFTSRFSGTTEELADLRHSFLIREGRMLPVDFRRLFNEGDLTQNVALEPGDYIYMPSSLAQEVYVLGAVNQPKAVGFRDRVTLVSAISAARDVRAGARVGEVLILRGSLQTPAIYLVDYEAIRRGRAPDIDLEPRDVVWVPDKPWDNLDRYARTVVNTFVRTLAANEGANFAVPDGKATIVTPVSGP